ncbi:metallophosphoesterase family protein [uncultured Sphingomonas sp.]|uniref:metallophosphoesterase family protein n=1 Tax=uncultured Sphingomonas sp. TaxID=158754 RepID=UPI0035CA7ACD
MTSGGSSIVEWRTDIDGGQVSTCPGERAVYAIGDVHGRYDLAKALLSAIVADIRTLPDEADPLIVFLGDYVDRGPQSADVLSMLVWMMRHAPCETTFLKGNHEAMLLAFLDAPREAGAWLRFGGEATLRSYGVEIGDDEVAEDRYEALRDTFMDRLPSSHLEALRQLPTSLICGDYVFVHAGLRPGISLARQSDDDRLWIRRDFLAAEHAFEKTVVHGHTWDSQDPVVTQTRIGIDTGAYRTGVLTALRLVGSTQAFLQARATDEITVVSLQDSSDR